MCRLLFHPGMVVRRIPTELHDCPAAGFQGQIFIEYLKSFIYKIAPKGG